MFAYYLYTSLLNPLTGNVSTNKKNNMNDIQNESLDLTTLSATELADMAVTKWDTIADTKDAKVKKVLVKEYNELAEVYNKLVGRDDLTIISKSTKVIKTAEPDTIIAKEKKVVTKTKFVPEGMTGKGLKAAAPKKADPKKTVIKTTLPEKKKVKKVNAKVTKVTDAKGKSAPISKTKIVREKDGKELGTIGQILHHHKKGLTNKEIVALGYNYSTVNKQVKKYITENAKKK